LKSHPEQHSRVEFEEFRTALAKLPPISVRHSSSSARRDSPMRRLRPSVIAQSGRSRAGSIGRARGCPNFCRSTARMISGLTTHPRDSLGGWTKLSPQLTP
jgi:hypothetical protein